MIMGMVMKMKKIMLLIMVMVMVMKMNNMPPTHRREKIIKKHVVKLTKKRSGFLCKKHPYSLLTISANMVELFKT